jgi:hypothetical protein
MRVVRVLLVHVLQVLLLGMELLRVLQVRLVLRIVASTDIRATGLALLITTGRWILVIMLLLLLLLVLCCCLSAAMGHVATGIFRVPTGGPGSGGICLVLDVPAILYVRSVKVRRRHRSKAEGRTDREDGPSAH